jgi:putative membrane protein
MDGKHTSRAAVAVLITALLAGCSSNTDSAKFLGKAEQDSLAEVRVCQLALERSSSDDVKRFARQMIDDHNRVLQQVGQLAAKKRATLPQDVTAEQKETYGKLEALSGAAFDKEFMDHNVSDHKADIKDFAEQAEKGSDPDVKAFASATLPTLQKHLEMSQQVDAAVKS